MTTPKVPHPTHFRRSHYALQIIELLVLYISVVIIAAIGLHSRFTILIPCLVLPITLLTC